MRYWIAAMAMVVGCSNEDPICLSDAIESQKSAEDLVEEIKGRLTDSCESAYGSGWFFSAGYGSVPGSCANVERRPLPTVENCGGGTTKP